MAFDNYIIRRRHLAPGIRSFRSEGGIRWWDPILPARAWLRAEALVERSVRTLIDRGVRSPRRLRFGMRVSASLSRAAFNSRRFWAGKFGRRAG
ncbi:MAG: hypothetical protein V4459_08640 [Pseudomonadota bacterium]